MKTILRFIAWLALASALHAQAVSGGGTAAASAATTATITNDTTTNATMFPVWVTANSGSLPLKVASTKLSFNPSTGSLTATNHVGTFAGNTFTTGTGTLTLAAAKVFTVNSTMTFTGTDSTTMTFPTTTATIARTDAAQAFTGVQTFNSAPVANTGIYSTSSSGTGGVSYGSNAPIIVYVKSVTMLTAGTPADIATITIPAGITRWAMCPGGSFNGGGGKIFAETAAGTLAAGTVVCFDAAGGTGVTVSSSSAPPTGAALMTTLTGGSQTAFSTSSTIYIRQTGNSANAGTCSFYLIIYPIP